MKPARVNLDIRQGEPFKRLFIYQNPDESPIDLSGWTALLQVRRRSGLALIDELSDGNGITLGAAAGTIEIDLTAVQTNAIPQVSASYELKLTDSLGEVWIPIAGRATYAGVITE